MTKKCVDSKSEKQEQNLPEKKSLQKKGGAICTQPLLPLPKPPPKPSKTKEKEKEKAKPKNKAMKLKAKSVVVADTELGA